MQTLSDLQAKFQAPGVTIEAGQGGLVRVSVDTPAAQGHVYLYGAHVTHYQPKGKKPVLFMSGKSLFTQGKAIRGGVPLIFPWFGPRADDPKAPQHGFARSQEWDLKSITRAGDAVTVTLSLSPTDLSRNCWPNEFACTFVVTFGAKLEMSLEVRNTGSSAFRYEDAMHTYLAIDDVRQAKVDGLAGRTFIDKVDKAQRKTQPPGPFTLIGETDRVYLATPDAVTVTEPGRTLSVSKAGSAATVVWNPWIDKAKAMADFGDDEWPGMICVETANAADAAVTLQPGESHVTRATISAS